MGRFGHPAMDSMDTCQNPSTHKGEASKRKGHLPKKDLTIILGSFPIQLVFLPHIPLEATAERASERARETDSLDEEILEQGQQQRLDVASLQEFLDNLDVGIGSNNGKLDC